tara:strand:- start:927 stop:1091 length:165 start_codon:yes stop_codon:yes gene_type:complete
MKWKTVKHCQTFEEADLHRNELKQEGYEKVKVRKYESKKNKQKRFEVKVPISSP